MIKRFSFFQRDMRHLGTTALFGLAAIIHLSPAKADQPSNTRYIVQNLVSDIPNLASITDTNLLNPWGLAFGPSTPFWVSDNHAGLSTVYNSTGGVQSVVVTIPPPSGGTPPAAPTGILFNTTTNFTVNGAPAKFIFATEDGTISAWSSGTTAVLEADNSGSDTIYKGIALASNNAANFLYAADFKGGKIDVFDANFQLVKNANSFVDPSIPAGFAPFNVANIGGNLFVTYAKQDEDKEDDVRGDGNGYINVFDPAGNLLKRFASTGTLNSPWGLVMAPTNFGGFGGALLTGNFGDGRINAFDPGTGNFLGQLQDSTGAPLRIEGLWDLKFGNGTKAGDTNKLYFTAGVAGEGELEDHGLFGSVSAGTPDMIVLNETRNGSTLTLSWSGGMGPFVLQKKVSLSDANWSNQRVLPASSTTVNIEGPAGFFRILDQAGSP